MENLPALPGLFLIALLAATVLPAQSEFVLARVLRAGQRGPDPRQRVMKAEAAALIP